MRLRLYAFAVLALPCLAADPLVTVSSPILVFNGAVGGAAPSPATVTVTSDSPVTIAGATTTYLAGAPGWLGVVPPAGQITPVGVQLAATTAGLQAGTYIAQVQLAATGSVSSSSQTTVTVFLNLGGAGSGLPTTTISATPTSLAFSYRTGNSVPASQNVGVETSDSSDFSIGVVTDDGNHWLIATPSTSTSPGDITVSVNPVTLKAGTYSGVVNVTVPPYAVKQVPVTLTVDGPSLTLDPLELNISMPQNNGFSVPYQVRVISPSAFSFNAVPQSDRNWLLVDTPVGTTPTATITVRANNSGLEQGTYSGSVTMQTPSGTQSVLPVTLTVGPPGSLQLQPGSVSFFCTMGDAAPAAQTVNVNSLTGSAQTFTVSSDADWLTVLFRQPFPGGGTPATTPVSITLAVKPQNLLAGTYLAVVTLTPASGSPQQIGVSLTVNAPPSPVITSVTNAATYKTGAVAPGEFVVIFGANLGPRDLAVPPANTAPKTLGDISATFDGIPGPILYASSKQTAVQVPYGIAQGQTILTVNNGGVSTATTTLPSAATAPGLFTANSSGQGQISALNQNFSVNSASNPVARGDFIFLYGTGAGRTTPATVEGVVVGTSALPVADAEVKVNIGGQNAVVQYSGETPGNLAGLLQINAIVPANISPDANVPVVVTVGGQPVQANITIAVK